MENYTVKTLLNEEQIASGIKRVADEIARDYKEANPLLIGILKGAFIFIADLARAISIPCQIEFMEAKSYGLGNVSSGDVKITKDIGVSIEGRDVIIVEDILETANTLYHLCEDLRKRAPHSLKVCVFLDKKGKRIMDLEADYVCFDVGDEFVVGYGLDFAEEYRDLPYLAVLKQITAGEPTVVCSSTQSG